MKRHLAAVLLLACSGFAVSAEAAGPHSCPCRLGDQEFTLPDHPVGTQLNPTPGKLQESLWFAEPRNRFGARLSRHRGFACLVSRPLSVRRGLLPYPVVFRDPSHQVQRWRVRIEGGDTKAEVGRQLAPGVVMRYVCTNGDGEKRAHG